MYLRTVDIENLLKSKYGPPESAIIFNVANGTGADVSRWADALAMGIWPSRGLDLTGFEIKAHRSDWLRELKKPEKAEQSLFHYCDRWFVVASDGVAKVDEIPEPWGLLVAKAKGEKLTLCVEKAAPKLTPKPVNRNVLAAIFRRVNEQNIGEAELNTAIRKAKDDGIKIGEQSHKYVKEELEKLTKAVKDFEDASGVLIDRWEGGRRIGEAVRLVLDGSHPLKTLTRLRDSLTRIIEEAQPEMVEENTLAGQL